MAFMKKLTEYSFIIETNKNEKIGVVVNYDEGTTEKTGIEFFSSNGSMKFSNISELENVIGEKIKYKEQEVNTEHINTNFIDEYPVNDTDKIYNIEKDEDLGISTFNKSKSSKKKFYPGWWIIKNESGSFSPRCTISVSNYNLKKENEEIHGPFKSYMEMSYVLKNL